MNKMSRILAGVTALIVTMSLAACASQRPIEGSDEPPGLAGRSLPCLVSDLISADEMEGVLQDSVKVTDHPAKDGYLASDFKSSQYQIRIAFYQEVLLPEGDPREGQAWTTYLEETKEELRAEQDALAINETIRRSPVDDYEDTAFLTFIDSKKEIQLDIFYHAYWVTITLTYSSSGQSDQASTAITDIGAVVADHLAL